MSPPQKRTHRQREHGLSHWVDKFLDRVITEPCWYTAVDHSGESIGRDPEKQMHWRQKQRAQGIKPSQLDWYVVQFDPVTFKPAAICWIELKQGRNRLTDGQETTIRLLRQRGQVADEARTIHQCLALLRQAGFALHGNADNIAILIQAEADASSAAPRKAKRSYGPALRRAPLDPEGALDDWLRGG